MLKFQQIGQRAGEEVTSIDDKGGVAKHVEADRAVPANTVVGASVAGSSVSSVTRPPPPEKAEEDPDDEPGQIHTVKADEAGSGDEPGQIGGGESAAEASKGEEIKEEEEVGDAAAAQEEDSKKADEESTKQDSEPKKEEEEDDAAAMFFAAGEAPSQEESATAPVSEGDTPIDADQQQSAGEADSTLYPEEDESTDAAASAMQSEAGDTATEGENVISVDGTTTATPEGEDGAGVFDPLGAPSDEEVLLDDEEEVWDEELEEEVVDEEVYVDEYGQIIEDDLDENGNVVEEDIDLTDNLPSAASMFGAKAQDPPADTFDIEKQDEVIEKKPKEKTKFNPYIAVCACLAVIAAVVVIVLYIVLDIDEEDTPRPTVRPTPSPPPTNMPTVMLVPDIVDQGTGLGDSETTTSFDPIISDGCDFTGLIQPDIYDQCRCGGQIMFLAKDVRTRYSDLVKNFIPSIAGGYEGTISSCTPRNQALVWLSAGINNGGESNSARIQRFAMAEFFYEQEGLTWTDSTNWLSSRSVCSWYGITCNADRVISKIELGDNNLTGQVRAFLGPDLTVMAYSNISFSLNYAALGRDWHPGPGGRI